MVLGGWSVRIGVAGIIAALIGILALLPLSGCSSSKKSAKLDPFAGQGSPRYPGNGPLPRGGGRYQLGEPYQVAGRWFTPRELMAMILAGKIDDAKTITGFFLWKARAGGRGSK